MKLFVTSNQQFGRPGAINAYKRPFKSVDEMNEYMFNQWNSVVSEGDIVFVLGNLAWDPEITEEVVAKLNGNIYAMQGEWDRSIKDITDIRGGGTVKLKYLTEGIKMLASQDSVLSYWPLTEWPRKKKGYVSFIGHPAKKYKSNHTDKIVNVQCDRWDFKPIEIKSMVTLYRDPDLNQEQI